jgi:uncharacterized protein YjiS (DUF1127 family)
MSKPLVQGSSRTLVHFPGGYARVQQDSPPTSVVSWTGTVRIWSARRRERLALRELAELDDHFLKDIGVSRGKVLREAAKQFWQR